MRQAPECLDSAHISVRLRELVHMLFLPIIRRAEGRPLVSTSSPLLSRFMIKVSTQSAGNLVGILVAYLGRSAIKLLSS